MPQAGLPSFRNNSGEFSSTEQFDRWRAGIGGSFDVLPAAAHSGMPGDAASFGFSGNWWRYGPVLLGEQNFDAHDAVRTARHVRSDQIDHYRIVLRMEGEMRSDAEGIRQVLQPGELLFNDMSRPESLSHARGKNVVLVVPREVLDEALPRPMDLHGLAPRGAMAGLLTSHLQSMVAAAPKMDVQSVQMLNQATLSLIAALLAPSRDMMERASPVVESTRLRQMCRYIELHLNEPTLSTEQLIGFFKVSRASLYRLFEPMGGVANFIKERRLARMHALLAGATSRLSIGSLAEDNGFRSATHFSRAFREQYGYSPKDVQQGTHLAAPQFAQALGGGSLVAWMRALRD